MSRVTAVVGRGHERTRGAAIAGVLRSRAGRLGSALVGVTVGLALLGPAFAPYGSEKVVGPPFSPPSPAHLLGTDFLGRDLLSRVLHGGQALLVISVVSTALAYLIGGPVGLLAGYRSGRSIDLAIVGVTDLFLAFPHLVLVLILLAATGPSLPIVVVGIAIGHVPRILRIVRAATIEVRTLEFVEAAVARGEGLMSILRRDLLPNISSPLLADFGLRLTFSILAYSGLAYLGLAQPPPAADWGLLISENRIGIAVQPLVVLVPAAIIAALANGINLVSDAIARSIGRSLTKPGA